MDEQIDFKRIKNRKGKESLKIICPEYLGIGNVIQCQQSMIENLSSSKDQIQIDASRIQRSDACGIQLLYSLIRWAAKENRGIKWQKPSEVLVRSVKLMGLTEPMLLTKS